MKNTKHNSKNNRGFTLIELMIVVAIIAVIASIALPGLLRAKQGSRETAALGAVRTISTAQAVWLNSGVGVVDGVNVYASSVEALANPLQGEPFVEKGLANGLKHGYEFIITQATSGGYELRATPVDTDEATKMKHFFTNHRGEIYFNVGAPADDTSNSI